MKKDWKRIAVALALIAAVSVGAAAAAGSAGTESDPLVTLSYLEKVFAPTVEAAVDRAVAANEKSLKAELDAAIDRWSASAGSGGTSTGTSSAAFRVVTLSRGQTLTGEVGCEVMLRIGTAVCVSSSSPGLIDTTGGGTLNDGGSLATNHLYMVTIATRGVRATAGTVKVLVRGSYTVS